MELVVELLDCYFGGIQYCDSFVVQCVKLVDFDSIFLVCVLCEICEVGNFFLVYILVISQCQVVELIVWLFLFFKMVDFVVIVQVLLDVQCDIECIQVGDFDIFVVVYWVSILGNIVI